MDTQHRHGNEGIRIGRLLVVIGACLGLAACGTFALRQGWDPNYGPVVPHDTFPADCSLCHVSGNWHTIKEDFAFDHGAETGVDLHGAHMSVPCLLCHNDRGPVETFAARGCAGCHIDPHRSKLGRLCEDCHSEDNWYPVGMIAEHSRTRFPLIGAHAVVSCDRCHEGAHVGNFEGLDVRCESCHMEDLARAVDPDHAAQGWTQDCQRCHLQLAWRPAIFDHPATFPLAGGHGGLDCAACHAGDVFTGLSTDCVTCHLDDYQMTTDPDHTAAGFSTMCDMCHNTNGWGGANFLHSFPRTGPHNVDCSDCHLTPGNYMDFSCTHCHEHRQSKMDDVHSGVGGYVWTSNACLGCHPNGRE